MVVAVVALLITSCGVDDASTTEEEHSSQIVAEDTARGVLVPASEAGIDSLVLRYTLGSVYRYRVTQMSEAGPDSAVAKTKSQHYYTKTVRAVRSDGSFEVTMRFDSIRIDATVSNRASGNIIREQHYASTDSVQRSDANFVQFNALLGEDVSLFVTPQGTVQEVGDVSPILKKLIATSRQQVPKEALEGLSEQIKIAAYAAFHTQEFVPYPKDGIDSNGHWSNVQSSALDQLFTVNTTAHYKIASVRKFGIRRLAMIEATVEGRVATRPLPPESGIKITLERSSITGKSSAVIDPDLGITISKKNTITLNVGATIRNTKTQERRTESFTQVTRYEIELLR